MYGGSLAYRVLADRIEWDVCEVDVGVDELPNSCRPAAGVDRREVGRWLLDVLVFGPLESKALFAQARDCGICDKALRRAAADLGLRPAKTSFDGPWSWRLCRPGAKGQDAPR
jgi:hypothetical protein